MGSHDATARRHSTSIAADMGAITQVPGMSSSSSSSSTGAGLLQVPGSRERTPPRGVSPSTPTPPPGSSPRGRRRHIGLAAAFDVVVGVMIRQNSDLSTCSQPFFAGSSTHDLVRLPLRTRDRFQRHVDTPLLDVSHPATDHAGRRRSVSCSSPDVTVGAR